MKNSRLKTVGFTLIELLIVVAIIAILAAIAVPNFLEAQTRAKVSSAKSNMRTCVNGLESYFVDNNKYPPDRGFGNFYEDWSQITTPIAYLSSIPLDPFPMEEIPPVLVPRARSNDPI